MEWLAYVLAGLPGTLLALLAATGIVTERTAVILFAPSFIGLNLAHMASAWGHAYVDAPGWRGAPVERVVIPALIVLGCLGLESLGWGALLLTAQYWLSIHHAGMQNYGILRARAPGGRIEQAACVLLPLGALAYRARAVCAEYDGAHLPAPPAWLAPLLMSVGVVALFAFVIRARKADLLSVTLVVGLSLLWSGLLIGLRHPALPLYALASGHYVQQLYFAYRHQRRWTSPLKYLAGTTAVGAAVVILLTASTVAARRFSGADPAIPPWVAAMIGVNLWHYWIESRIWRRRASAARLPA